MTDYDFQNNESEALKVRLVVQMKKKHNKILTEEEVETIDAIFGNATRNQLVKLIQYRLVNCFLAVILILSLFLFDTNSKWYLTTIVSFVFFIINLYCVFYNSYKVSRLNRR